MSDTRQSSNDMSDNNNNNSQRNDDDEMIIDAATLPDPDDDDDELILVFPSASFSRNGNCNISSSRSSSVLPTASATSKTGQQQPILLRPRHVSSSMFLSPTIMNNDSIENHASNGAITGSTVATTMTVTSSSSSSTNGTHFRVPPSCRKSPSIWSTILHQHQRGGSNSGSNNFGMATTATTMTANRIYRSPLSPRNQNQGNQYSYYYHNSNHHHSNTQLQYRPPTQAVCYSNSTMHHNDHQLQNHYSITSSALRSPDKTPTRLPCIPIIPSPPVIALEDDTESTEDVNNDPSYQVDCINHENLASLVTVPIAGTNDTTVAKAQRLPVTTATVAASLRMRKRTPSLLQQQLISPISLQRGSLLSSSSSTTTSSTTANSYSRMMPFHY